MIEPDDVELSHLRTLARDHEARLRLAQRAVDVLEERTIHLNLLIEQTALILGHLRSLRLILAGEVADVSGVR